MMGYYDFGYMGFFGWFWMILLWIGVIWLIVWLVGQSQKNISPDKENPSEILKKRYVKGEITEEEYDKMRQKITNT